MALDIRLVPALQDNYIFVAHEPDQGVTFVVDPAEAGPVEELLRAEGWGLDLILNTHHHYDHVGANEALKAAWGCRIYGPAADEARIPGIDAAFSDGDDVAIGAVTARVLDVPGHTRGHIAWWFRADQAAFVGDTVFAGGCGRMFEGTPPQFWASLDKLRTLPPGTRLYCAHEYTEANLRFAVTVEPDNEALQARIETVRQARERGVPTVPTTVGQELETNPFLRCDHPDVAAYAGLPPTEPAAVFGAVRGAKDEFRG